MSTNPRAASIQPSGGPHTLATLVRIAMLVCITLPMPLRAQRNPVESAIRGEVRDETTGQGVPQVFVEFLNGRTRVRASAQTDASGSFLLAGVPTGSFRLRATRMGYAKTITPYWRVLSGETLSVIVWLDPDAVLLAPLEITARSRSLSPVVSGFYQRLKRGTGGVFITREDIERSGPFRISDLLESVPGLEIENTSGQGGQGRRVRFARSRLASGGGQCQVQVFVDGVLASRRSDNGVDIDEFASPSLLEGIEVYRGVGTLPPEFVTPEARCGVIALWTRRGG